MKTLFKLLQFFAFSILLSACHNDEDEALIGDYGYHLAYQHVPAEEILALANAPTLKETDCAALNVSVMSALTKVDTYDTPQHYFLKGDKAIEQQIAALLDPKNDKYNGTMPIIVQYTTEECKSIKISLYDNDNNLVADITDNARFCFVYGVDELSEIGHSLIINADRQLVGKIENGATIQQYLSLRPMVFAEARFVFPDLGKETFADGKHAVVEIELSNGNKLVTASTTYKDPQIRNLHLLSL